MAGPRSLAATTSREAGSYLPGLLGIAAALGIWMLAQPVAEEARSLRQQIGIVGQSRSLAGEDAMIELEKLARQAAQRRAAIDARLQTREPPAVAHAKVLHDLRQRCAAAGIQNCAVRYVDDTAAPATAQRPAATAGAPATLAGLGLGRSKAVISGLFQDLEFRNLINQLERQPDGIWRISALTVRSNRFELEAELITRPPPTALGTPAR